MLATLQPTKEQVRVYMHQRQRAFERRHAEAPAAFPGTSTLFFPGTIAQLAALLAVEWCFLAAGISRSH